MFAGARIFLLTGAGILLLAGAIAPTACGGGQEHPGLESVRAGLPPEYRAAYSGETGRTVFELLEEAVEEVDWEQYGAGRLVIAINGISNGTEGRNWLYYVNGEAGQVAANQRQVVDGDEIEWLFMR